MKTKITLLAAFIFSIAQSFAVDGYLSNLNIGNYVKTNYNYSISADIKNNSGAITSCVVSWQLNTGSVTSKTVNIGGGGITSSTYMPVTLNGTLNLPAAGPYVLKVWVTASGDINHANDTIIKNIIALSTYANGKVLIEELTGTWCPNCPPGLQAVDAIATNPNAVPVSFHGGDAYSFANGKTHMESYFPSTTYYYPSAIINMGEMGGYPINSYTTVWNTDVAARVGISPVEVKIVPNFNYTTRLLTVTYTANFKYAFSGDFYLNAYVLQNNVLGSQNDNGTYVSWTFNHLVRKMLGGMNGVGGVVPANPVINTDYSQQDTMTLPASWNINNIDVVAFIFEKNGNNTNCINAQSFAFATEINEIDHDNDFSIFPNPTNGILNIQSTLPNIQFKSVEVYNMLGEKIYYSDINVDGSEIDLSNQPKGIYFVQVQTNEGIVNKKIIIQ